MQHASYPEVPDAFGYWLAGFIDGEAHFCIERRTRKASSKWRTDDYRTYSCRVQIGLRADDILTLERIARITGIGSVRTHHTPTAQRGGYSPIAYWYSSSRADCAATVALLDRFPLLSKKARDYAIWRDAVAEWLSVETPPLGTIRYGYQGRDWSRMAELRDQIMATRKMAA